MPQMGVDENRGPPKKDLQIVVFPENKDPKKGTLFSETLNPKPRNPSACRQSGADGAHVLHQRDSSEAHRRKRLREIRFRVQGSGFRV